MELSFSKFEEHIFLNTVLIENMTDGEAGTGFFVKKFVDEKTIKILVFSNKHVFWGKKDKDNKNVQKQLRLTFHIKDTAGSFVTTSTKSFTIDLKRSQEGYFDHPDQGVDVGCMNISEVFNSDLVHVSTLDIEKRYCDYDYVNIMGGQQIFFVGYPSLFYDKKNYLPIMRTGIIASVPRIDFNGERCVLVDAPVFGGSSGSPVFITHNGNYKLLGIISQSVSVVCNFIPVQVPAAESKTAHRPVESLNIGIVFKKETIQELLALV